MLKKESTTAVGLDMMSEMNRIVSGLTCDAYLRAIAADNILDVLHKRYLLGKVKTNDQQDSIMNMITTLYQLEVNNTVAVLGRTESHCLFVDVGTMIEK